MAFLRQQGFQVVEKDSPVDGETVVEDDMHAKDVVDTINNEYGKTMNV